MKLSERFQRILQKYYIVSFKICLDRNLRSLSGENFCVAERWIFFSPLSTHSPLFLHLFAVFSVVKIFAEFSAECSYGWWFLSVNCFFSPLSTHSPLFLDLFLQHFLRWSHLVSLAVNFVAVIHRGEFFFFRAITAFTAYIFLPYSPQILPF